MVCAVSRDPVPLQEIPRRDHSVADQPHTHHRRHIRHHRGSHCRSCRPRPARTRDAPVVRWLVQRQSRRDVSVVVFVALVVLISKEFSCAEGEG